MAARSTAATPERVFTPEEIEAIDAQIDACLAIGTTAWRKSAIFLSEDVIDAVIVGVKLRKRDIQLRNIRATLLDGDALAKFGEADEIESRLVTLADTANVIADHVGMFKAEVIGQKGNAKEPKKFRVRMFKTLVMNGELTVVHRQEIVTKPAPKAE